LITGKKQAIMESMIYSRREIGKLALAALPATRLCSAKPNSLFGGVQVGINAPYSFHNIPGTADDILNYMTQLNLSAAELRLQPVEAYLKAPTPWVAPHAASRNPSPAAHARTKGGAGRRRRSAGEVAALAIDGRIQGLPQEVRRFRRLHSDRQVRRHQHISKMM
jgi:hypothetical protein